MAINRVFVAVIVIALASVLSGAETRGAPLAIPGFDSEYCGESAFVQGRVGDTVSFTVCFVNTGTTTWTKSTGTAVGLAVCIYTPAPQGQACNVMSPYASWAVNWFSSTVYAVPLQTSVAPGSAAMFTYNVRPPAGTLPDQYYFMGEVILLSTGEPLNPQGYYQIFEVIP